MPEKKDQHFIPKLYLRSFSNDADRKRIHFYQISTSSLKTNIPLENQAQEAYFYGKDQIIEDTLEKLESDAAIIIKTIKENDTLPAFRSKEYWTIWTFTLIQAARTRNKANETNELIDRTIQIGYKETELFKKYGDLKFFIDNAPAFNLQTLARTIDVAQDLHCKLVINKSNVGFITSDDPVIKFNQFLEKRKFPAGKDGLAIKGLQIFYPLSPTHLLIFYDPKIYKVGERKKRVINTTNEKDVLGLNILQALYCNDILYFNNKTSNKDIYQIISIRNKFYRKDQVVVNDFMKRTLPNGHTSEVYHFYTQRHNFDLNLTFIKQTDYAKNYKLTGFAVELRDENLRGKIKH